MESALDCGIQLAEHPKFCRDEDAPARLLKWHCACALTNPAVLQGVPLPWGAPQGLGISACLKCCQALRSDCQCLTLCAWMS